MFPQTRSAATPTNQPPADSAPTGPGWADRPLVEVLRAQPTIEGGDLRVNRPFPTPAADWFDPFLLLDEMAPNRREPGEASGVPPHPHRGFETVTYMFSGEIEHRDSAGNQGVIGPGDVQWMTAGDGIVHSEMPSTRLQTEGGTIHGIQLWVNLPADLRRTTPRYQGLVSDDIPTVSADGWSVHLIAGQLFGQRGPAESHTPITYARVTLKPCARLQIPVADGHTALAYVVSGVATVGAEAREVAAQHLAVFERSTGDLAITAPTTAAAPVELMVLAGQPIDEPMERYGPFVMNTRAELAEAIDDFNAGLFGQIPATGSARTRYHPMPDTDEEHQP